MTKVSPWGSLNEDYPNFIAVSRYARWIEDEGRRETWAETVNRYATFMSNKLGDKIDDKTVVELHNAILDQEIMPSMRALMTSGEALERENIAGYNPVSGDTVVLTSDGMKEIRSLSGKSATVLNKDGRWADAEFRGYGDQDVFNVVLRRKKSGTTHTVVATGNHRWVKTNGDVVSTAELVSGDKIPYSVAPRPDTDNIDYQLGVFHGLVYGDGTSTYSQERLKCYHIRLKELPVGETPEYNLGFLRGWIAANGSVAKSSSQVTLCVNSDGLEWFDTYAPTVGILRTVMPQLPDTTDLGERKITAYSLRLDRASMIADDFIIGCERDRFIPLDYEVDYAVVSVSPAGKSDVYCAEVPDTNTFVLSNGIVTGNCAFVAVDNVRAFDEALYVLMNGTGLGFNVESAYVSKLPSMPPEFFDTETTIVVHDSKLGWAKAYKELIALLLQGQVPSWDLSRVRPAGAKLKTFGGRASGPDPLDKLFTFTVESFKRASGRKLKPIEVHDIMCKIAEVVVVGGVRRCLPSDAQVQTPTGNKSMAEIAVGDSIVSGGRIAKVSAKVDSGEQQLIVVKHKFGQSRMTPNHRIAVFTAQDSYAFKDAGLLEPGDKLVRDLAGYDGARFQTLGGHGNYAPVEVIEVSQGTVEQTWDIEVEDIHEFTADGLVTHNSALISMSDLDDFDMSQAKSGQWWEHNGQRALANNSAVYYDKPSVGQFFTEWSNLYESKSGERGIINMGGIKRHVQSFGIRDASKIVGKNPCAEINLRSCQYCNLTEAVIDPNDTLDAIRHKVKMATILGTYQATLTDFKYIRPIWKKNTEEERLLGVSLTGIYGHKFMSGQLESVEGMTLPEFLRELRELTVAVNAEWAEQFGIPASAALTTVKPSGTVSQLVGASSGIHPWYAPYYVRTVRGDNKDPLTQFLKAQGVPNEPDATKPDDTTVFSFPIKAPSGVITSRDLSAIEHLQLYCVYRENWTDHDVSVTINVREEEWPSVGAWVYDNFDRVGGVSFLPFSDHTYKQAPYQAISEDEYNVALSNMPTRIDWVDLPLYELEDNTTGNQTLACSGSSCEIVDITK